jgi:inner membrane transporter RhtA
MTPAGRGSRVPPWARAFTAMCSIQVGSALSVGLIATVGPAGTAWLRLTIGAVIFVILARPPLRSIHRRDLPVLVALGAITGIQTVAFLAAIERIPLGTSVAIEFLGPMIVAAARTHTRPALAWPAIAAVGVALLTHPWQGAPNAVGVACAAIAAVGWAGYILLTAAVGDRYPGIAGLALTTPIAAVTAGVVGIPQAAGHLTGPVLGAGTGLALLIPVIP